MTDPKLEELEAALAAVGDRMASERRWEDIAPGVRRQLWRPYRDLAGALSLTLGLAVLGFWDPSMWVVALLALGLFVPGTLQAARRRRHGILQQDRNLFAVCYREAEERYQKELLLLIFGLPLVFAFVAAAVVLPDTRVPLILAGALFLYLPYHFFVRLPKTSREVSEVRRWTEAAKELPPGSKPTADVPPWKRSLRKASRIALLVTVCAYVGTTVLDRTLELQLWLPEVLLWALAVAWVVTRLLVGEESIEEKPVRFEETLGEGEEEKDDDDDDDEESWASIILGIVGASFRVFVFYLAPIFVLISLVQAATGSDPTRPLIIAGALAVLWTIVWLTLDSDDESESNEEGDA